MLYDLYFLQYFGVQVLFFETYKIILKLFKEPALRTKVNPKNNGVPFHLLLSDLPGSGDPTNGLSKTVIAICDTNAQKPHRLDKAGIIF